MFLAIGNGPSYSSDDGQAWTQRAALPAGTWTAVTRAPALGRFVAVGHGVSATSEVGDTWVSGGTPGAYATDVAWSEELGLAVAVGAGAIASSPDGSTWTTRSTDSYAWRRVAWSPALGLFLAVADEGIVGGVTRSARLARSSDGVTWTIAGSPDVHVTAAAWSETLALFVLTAYDQFAAGTVYTSPDGSVWTSRGLLGIGAPDDVAWSETHGLFVAVGDQINNAPGKRAATSPDGTTWTARTVPKSGTGYWRRVAVDETAGALVVVDDEEKAYSADAVTWTQQADFTNAVAGLVAADTNRPPTAPLLLAPADGASIDLGVTNRFDWDFSDPDSGDTQSRATLYYRPVGATTWTTVTVTGPSTYHDMAGGTLVADDYEWQVETEDAAGAVGARSASSFFTAATPTGVPTIIDPINGATVGSDPYTVQWSTAGGQDAYQIRVVADDGSGGADELTVLYDTGQVDNAAARSASVPFPDNGVYRHVQVRVYLDGLWSSWASHRVLVSYTPPPMPTVTPATSSSAGAVSVTVSTPAPATGEPTVEYVDIEVRDTSGADKYRPTEGVRVATHQTPDGTYTDRLAAAGVNYDYRAVAHGSNGTTSASAWTPIDADAVASVYYGGGY